MDSESFRRGLFEKAVSMLTKDRDSIQIFRFRTEKRKACVLKCLFHFLSEALLKL